MPANVNTVIEGEGRSAVALGSGGATTTTSRIDSTFWSLPRHSDLPSMRPSTFAGA
jgi:hypothetical protein